MAVHSAAYWKAQPMRQPHEGSPARLWCIFHEVLIFGRSFLGSIHDQNVQRNSSRLEFEAELLWQGGENRWSIRNGTRFLRLLGFGPPVKGQVELPS